MEHPYRIHSSICFSFLQLLFISSLAYPTPPPPLYHNVAVIRLMGTVYFTIFREKPFYLKIECITILLEVICDTLYIKYIIKDYTYIFGVLDIFSNILFCLAVILSFNNGETQPTIIAEKIESIRTTFLSCCCGWNPPHTTHQNQPPQQIYELNNPATKNGHLYKSIDTNDGEADSPIYTFGSNNGSNRQAFKPSFYNSSWGKEYIRAKVDREFERIDRCNTEIGEIGSITGADGTTQYIRFDDTERYNHDVGINQYASILISPYLMSDGTPITSLSGCIKVDKIGVCLFIYNLIQFIYQMMMYSSIITTCRQHNATTTTTTTTFEMERWLC